MLTEIYSSYFHKYQPWSISQGSTGRVIEGDNETLLEEDVLFLSARIMPTSFVGKKSLESMLKSNPRGEARADVNEDREGQREAGGRDKNVEVGDAVERRRGESDGGGKEQMETERESKSEERPLCAKQGFHVRRPSDSRRAEKRLTLSDGWSVADSREE